MKTASFGLKGSAWLAAALLVSGVSAHAAEAPKKLLVVTVTTGFRHSSIETAEKVLADLAASSGAFSVDFVRQPSGQQPKNPGRAPERKNGESDEAFRTRQEAYSEALANFNTANEAWNASVKTYMADQMAMDKIAGFDGFIFANTTGDLHLPAPDGFINLIREGKAFIAMHSGSDTYHDFRPYPDMLGGEFATHKEQVSVQPVVHDPAHPAARPIPLRWQVFDEIYIIKNFDPAAVHGLLGLKQHPNTKEDGYFPISWCREFGKGKVFYTSLGHREDVWDPEWKADTNDRKNSPEVARIFQQHVLGGILWALGVVAGEAPPGNIR